MEMEEAFNVEVKKRKWIYILRQVMVCSGVWTGYFMVGQFIGTPTVLVPQLRRDSSVQLDDEMASWIYSVFGFAAVPWVVILSVLSRRYGLRIPHFIACMGLLVAYISLYFSTSPLQILISEIIFGIGYASALIIGVVVISEYTSPEYRGTFLAIKSASLFWGVWSANAIGTFFHWRNIAYSGFLCAAYTFSVVFWPESPQWLASKGRYDECRKAYHWLQGHDEKTQTEVQELIASRMNAVKYTNMNKDWSSISDAIRTVTCKQFYTPLLLTALLVIQYHFAGKLICTIYVVEILKKMTSSESTAYMGMLILDGVTVLSMYFGCFLTKILNRRTLYLTSSGIGVAFLLITSLYLYLVKLSVIEESKVLSIVLLTCFSIAMGCGPMVMNTSIYAELIPLRFKSVLVMISALLFYIFFATLLKIAPLIFKSLGLHGSFLFFGLTSGFCALLLYKYLPETKDKTLQQIEENFKTYDLPPSETERLNKGDTKDKNLKSIT